MKSKINSLWVSTSSLRLHFDISAVKDIVWQRKCWIYLCFYCFFHCELLSSNFFSSVLVDPARTLLIRKLPLEGDLNLQGSANTLKTMNCADLEVFSTECYSIVFTHMDKRRFSPLKIPSGKTRSSFSERYLTYIDIQNGNELKRKMKDSFVVIIYTLKLSKSE